VLGRATRASPGAERALEQLRIALATWEPTLGPDAPQVTRLHGDLVAMLLRLTP
jgi:hypothetical protein